MRTGGSAVDAVFWLDHTSPYAPTDGFSTLEISGHQLVPRRWPRYSLSRWWDRVSAREDLPLIDTNVLWSSTQSRFLYAIAFASGRNDSQYLISWNKTKSALQTSFQLCWKYADISEMRMYYVLSSNIPSMIFTRNGLTNIEVESSTPRIHEPLNKSGVFFQWFNEIVAHKKCTRQWFCWTYW